MAEIYDKAWKLLLDPSRWCKEFIAMDVNGRQVHARDPKAVKFCAIGAIMKVYASSRQEMEMEQLLRENVPDQWAAYWNDTESHATVVGLLKDLDI